jgi:hypothetical protein
MIYSDIEKSIRGKTVAIVGNAQSLLQQEYGEMIDAHQVVIRMNFGFTYAPHLNRFVAPKQLGKKTDIICAGAALNILNQLDRYPNCKALVHMSGGNRNETVEKYSNKYYLYPTDYWESLKNVLTARPSTGMMVFDMVEQSKPSHVNIFGMDWKRTRTYYNDGKNGRQNESVTNPLGPHNWNAEREYIIGKVKKYGWDII